MRKTTFVLILCLLSIIAQPAVLSDDGLIIDEYDICGILGIITIIVVLVIGLFMYISDLKNKSQPRTIKHQEPPRYCINCGSPISVDARFCQNCGFKFN